jgi:DNA-binding winged helix-turn-helix (wHTH) protein
MKPVEFAGCVLNPRERTLLRDGRPVHLTPKAFDLLAFLIAERPAVVTKAQLHAAIWPGVTVTDASVNMLIAEIRRAVGDDPAREQVIRTIPRVGYSFSAEVVDPEAPSAGTSSSWRATWNSTTVALVNGANTLGRSSHCRLVVDDERVSRVHATIRIDEATDRATIEDNGSTNGTFLGKARVTEPVQLRNDNTIKLGSVKVTVRLRATRTVRRR